MKARYYALYVLIFGVTLGSIFDLLWENWHEMFTLTSYQFKLMLDEQIYDGLNWSTLPADVKLFVELLDFAILIALVRMIEYRGSVFLWFREMDRYRAMYLVLSFLFIPTLFYVIISHWGEVSLNVKTTAGLLVAGALFLGIRIFQSSRQLELAQKSNLETRFANMIQDLTVLGVMPTKNQNVWFNQYFKNMSTIRSLSDIAKQHPEEYHNTVMHIFSSILKNNKRDFRNQDDLNLIIDYIRERNNTQRMFERDDYFIYSDLIFNYINLRAASFKNFSLTSSHMENSYLKDAFFLNAKFISSTMIRSNFSGSGFNIAEFSAVKLRDAHFGDVKMRSVIFRGCDLSNVDFRGAFLSKVFFVDCYYEDGYIPMFSEGFPQDILPLNHAKYEKRLLSWEIPSVDKT